MVAQIVLLIFAILTAIGVAVYRATDENKRKPSAGWYAIPIIFLVVFLLVGSLFTIPAGNRGVVLRFGKVNNVAVEGLNIKAPLVDNVITLSVRTQLYQADASAASKDLQDVTTTIGINYKLDPSRVGEVFRTLGEKYIDSIAAPLVQEIVKEVTARYNAEDLILRRDEVKTAISQELTDKLAERGIVVEIVNITNFEFSDEFTKAIEAKVVAQQNIIRAEYELEFATIEAQQTRVRAQAQDEANRILSAHMTPQLLQYILIDRLGSDIKVIVVPAGQGLTLGGLESYIK